MSSYNKTDPETIQRMFGTIADRYDRTNSLLSFQLHKLWNAKFVKKILEETPEGPMLDLCSGTGDIAFAFLKKRTIPSKAYLLDFCAEMLDCAKTKAERQGLKQHEIAYIQGDAQSIPLPDGQAACATISYGIRNVQDPALCIRDTCRVLRPGGVLGVLELTRPTNPLMRFGHSLYLKGLLPILGKLSSSNKEAYEYLSNSIEQFIPPDELKTVLLNNGFGSVDIYPLTGGIATIWLARK